VIFADLNLVRSSSGALSPEELPELMRLRKEIQQGDMQLCLWTWKRLRVFTLTD
jgi:hypothetical protein